MAEGDGTDRVAGGSDVPDWLKGPAKLAVAALLTAGGVLTFVAAVGGAIVWVRYYSAQLPAEQALAALPRGELVASGAIMLAAFAILGALAVVGVYLFEDRKALNEGVLRALLVLVTAEALVVIVLTVDASWEQRILAGEAFLLCALLVYLILKWQESLERRGEEDADLLTWLRGVLALTLVLIPFVLAGILGWADDSGQRFWIVVLGTLLVEWVLIVVGAWVFEGFGDPPAPPPPPVSRYEPWWQRRERERARERAVPARQMPDVWKRRSAVVGAGLLALVGVLIPWLVVDEWWLAFTLATAVLLGIASWRLADTAGYNTFWCGVTVFVSVPLLGAVAGITRNIDSPQVQPVALIRKDDGVDEALQGIYVTETEDRIYLATVATNGCDGDDAEVQSRSGRLVWVPRDSVVTMMLGPAQGVDDAGAKALEMYYALAPEASVGRQAKGAVEVAGTGTPRRLDDLGPALRREFDEPARLAPESAAAGSSVTLHGSGFGDEPRTVRVDGAAATLVAPDGGGKAWTDSQITFAVPTGVTKGVVTIDCGDFARPAYFRLAQPPVAKLTARLAPRSLRVSFDSRGTSDPDKESLTREWRIDERLVHTGDRLPDAMPVSLATQKVGLRVVDPGGALDRAQVWLWRPPVEKSRIDMTARAAERAIARLRRVLLLDNARVEIRVHVPARGAGVKRPLELARAVRQEIVDGDLVRRGRVVVRVFGADCLQAGGRARTLDVVAMSDGVKIAAEKRCKPRVTE